MPKSPFFGVFAEKPLFLVISGTPLVLPKIHCFGGVRFPNGKMRKVSKSRKFHEKTRKTPKMSKMSPRNLTSEKVTFSTTFREFSDISDISHEDW